MRSVFITLIIILAILVIAFNVFQQYRLERHVAEVRISESQALNPRLVTIREGEEVKWTNTTDSLQLVTSIPERSSHAYLLNRSTATSSFHIGRIKPGKSRQMVFYEAGRYLYVCEVAEGRQVTTGVVTVKERE